MMIFFNRCIVFTKAVYLKTDLCPISQSNVNIFKQIKGYFKIIFIIRDLYLCYLFSLL